MNDGQSPEIPLDNRSDDHSDNQWVTFNELARRRGISKDAAHRLVRRKGWRRQSDNRGRVLVLVPAEELAQATVGRPADPSDDRLDNRSDDHPDDSPVIAAMQTAIEALKGENEALKGGNAAQASLIAELRIGLDQARVEVAEARQQVEALRQAEVERAAKGRWARLRAAWRGE